MSRKILIMAVLLSTLAAFAVPARASDGIDDALGWLETKQEPDGGFGSGFSEGSDLGATCDVVLAVSAAGQDASQWATSEGNSPLDYIYSQVAAGNPEAMNLKAKVALVLLATGQDPADFADRDLLAELKSDYDDETGSYGGNIFDQALVILALSGAGETVPDEATQFLLDRQTEDGAWALAGDTAAGAGDTNTTALVIQALVAVGWEDDIAEALDYLHTVQNDDGGFPYQVPSDYGTETDANSTAYVLQALLAADESLSDWAPTGTNPADALAALQDPDTGAFFWKAEVASPNLLATAQAVPALTEYTFVDLPQVTAASEPEAVAETETEILPETGSALLLPIALTVLGAIMAAIGLFVRRRRRISDLQ